MARSSCPVQILPSGWGMLLAAWKKGEDIQPLMGHLEWDAPVLVREDTGDSQKVSLAHPLVHALAVKPAGFSKALVEALVERPWGGKDFIQHKGNQRQWLPAMNNFYAWELLNAVVESRAFKVLSLLAEGLARSVSAFEYPSLATNELAKLVVSNLSCPDARTVIGVLVPHFEAQPNQLNLALHAFSQACLVGKGDLALELCQAYPKSVHVLAEDIINLVEDNQFEAAEKLLGEVNLPRKVFGEADSSPFFQEASRKLMEALGYAVNVVHEASQLTAPSPKLERRAERAYSMAAALLGQFDFPVATQCGASSESSRTLALALAHLPLCFPRLAREPAISADVLQAWLMVGPTDSPLLAKGLARYAEVIGQDAFRQIIGRAVEEKSGDLKLFREAPMAKKVERMDKLYDVLEQLSLPTRIPAQELAKSCVPSGLTKGGQALQWSQVVTRRLASDMDRAMAPAVLESSKPRL